MEKIISKKINSYRQQDLKKFDDKDIKYNYITIDDVLLLKDIQKDKCYLCNDELKYIYKTNCKYQFTLDRIDNNKPHLKDNVLL